MVDGTRGRNDCGGLGGPEEDHQRHHCCWTGRVGEREEEEEDSRTFDRN